MKSISFLSDHFQLRPGPQGETNLWGKKNSHYLLEKDQLVRIYEIMYFKAKYSYLLHPLLIPCEGKEND